MILDSGTILDICNQLSRFNNFRTAPPGDYLYAGDTKVPIQGYGDVDFYLVLPQGNVILRRYSIVYCKHFTCSIISFQLLRKQGIY
jgi:hypothetical protein